MFDNKISSDRLVDIFLELIRIDGLCGQEREVALYIKNFLNRLGFSPYEDNVKKYSGGNSGNIICRIGSGGDRVLVSHMDTARSTRKLKYVIQNGSIKSDGTTVLGVDNRAGIAVILYAIECALHHDIPLRDSTLVFTICEESTMDGSRYLSLNNSIRMGFVFDSAFEPGHFIRGTCGAVSFTVTVCGKASHAGLDPDKGINAIQITAEALSRVKTGKIDEHTIMNIGTIHGGSAINVVPEMTMVRGEIRSMDLQMIEKTLYTIQCEFESVVRNRGGSFDIEYSWDFKPYHVDDGSPAYREAIKALTNANLTPMPVIAWSGSDANYLNEKNIPTVNFGIGARNPHSNDEYIEIKDLIKSTDLALQLLTGK